jgi:hypothetical protein
VEVFTTPNYRYETRHISNTLEPVWEETFFLPVLEKDQVGGGGHARVGPRAVLFFPALSEALSRSRLALVCRSFERRRELL